MVIVPYIIGVSVSEKKISEGLHPTSLRSGNCGGRIKNTWLELSNLFQTFEDLESIKDKEADISSIRELLAEDITEQRDGEEPLC